MAGFRGHIAIIAVAGIASAALAAPAIGAASDLLRGHSAMPVSLDDLGSISSFTPTIRDERLSSAYARAAVSRNARNFRFTPTSGSMSGRREITVLVRADRGAGRSDDRASSLNLTPLAFNLDASRGWRKFALPETVGRKPLDPVSLDLAGVGNFSLDKGGAGKGKPSRLKTNVLVDARRDVGSGPQTLTGERPYSVDVGSSYSLTRNLNVTAGVRYAGPDNRLAPITDQRQDNQALYIGTIFKF
ncbi:MAG: hypothetical protein EP321_14190 [Sphingomonadales bacterium]|nr:MAG: hypothetical protein EP345_05085 [Sphingomonadales bacterium]TNF02340.1 MAG: hypothetical protein EP321_14190 [Sphingomonadales bacterium]